MYEIDDLTENILRFKILNSSTQNSFSSPRLVILSPKIEYNISLLNNSHFLSDDKLNYLESTEGLFDFEVNDIDSNNSVKNSILIIGAKSKSLKIESSVILNNVESHSFNMNSNEVHSFKDLNQHYLHKLVLRIKIDKLNYLIEIKNMLKHHIVITIK
jgi:hypothetical protein